MITMSDGSNHGSGHAYGFIGLGNMGGFMAINLITKSSENDQLLAFDTNPQSIEGLKSLISSRKLVVSTLEMIAQRADTIITCLPTPAAAEQVHLNLLSYQKEPRPSRLILDASTIDTATSLRIAERVQKAGFGIYVDAPMSGGTVGAKAGTLSFMVGSKPEVFTRLEPVLEKMGKKITHCGAQSLGLSAKLANNYILAINTLGTAEAMNFGIKAGLDPSVLGSVINTATGRSWASEVNNPVPGVSPSAPASKKYEGGFATKLMNKDLVLAILAAKQTQAPLILSEPAAQVFGKLADDPKYAGLDFTSVYQYLRGYNKAKL